MRFTRLLRTSVARVTFAALWARLMVLLVIAVASHSLARDSFDLLIYAIAASTAAQILLDPAVSSFVPVEWPSLQPDARATLFRSGLALQTIAGLAMALTTTLVVLAANTGRDALEIGVSLGLLAAVEGVGRYARVRYQLRGEFGRYAGLDVVIGVGRGATALALFASASILTFAVANLAWAAVFATALFIWTRKSFGRVELVPLIRNVWPYGASTSFASLYSQAPAVLLGLLGDLNAAAIYAVAARITQPTELVPSAISSVFLPRLTQEWGEQRRQTFLTQAKLAATIGALFALLITGGATRFLRIFGIDDNAAHLVLIVLAAVLPVKFINYQLVALALAEHRVRQRLRASMLVALISVTVVCLLAKHGALVVAAATLASECLLFTLLLRVSRATLLVPRTAA